MDATLDEPMDIDTSQLMPQTPLNNRVKQRPTDDSLTKSSEETSENLSDAKPFAKPPISGAKIIKPIPRPKLTKPYVPQANDFNEDDFVNLDPFKSKPKIGFESSSTSSTSITSTNMNTNPSNDDLLNENQLSDEWETHKKKSPNNNRKSLTKTSPNHEDTNSTHKTSQQETSPPTKQTSSVVSSNTDLSSSVSSSPPPPEQNEQNPLLVLSATSTSSLSSANTNSTSSIANSNGNVKEEFNFQTPKHQIYHTKLDHEEDEIKLSDDKLANLKKCQFIEGTRGGGGTPNDLNDDNLIDFKQFTDDDPTVATPKVNANDFKTDENLNAVDAVVFDSIFTNDNGILLVIFIIKIIRSLNSLYRFSIVSGYIREERSQFN